VLFRLLSLALHNGVTHEALTTLLGILPILASFLVERRVTAARSTQPARALTGLTVVVAGGLAVRVSPRWGSPAPASGALGISAGVMPQKWEMQTLWIVLPLQYAIRHAIAGRRRGLGPFSHLGRGKSCCWRSDSRWRSRSVRPSVSSG
jgi:hypothetical protein